MTTSQDAYNSAPYTPVSESTQLLVHDNDFCPAVYDRSECWCWTFRNAKPIKGGYKSRDWV